MAFVIESVATAVDVLMDESFKDVADGEVLFHLMINGGNVPHYLITYCAGYMVVDVFSCSKRSYPLERSSGSNYLVRSASSVFFRMDDFYELKRGIIKVLTILETF